jgi:hypothetical protein
MVLSSSRGDTAIGALLILFSLEVIGNNRNKKFND